MQNQQKSAKLRLFVSLATVILTACSISLFAQGNDGSAPKTQNEDKIYDFDHMQMHPGFPDGGEGFRAFLKKTLKYPAAAKKKKIEGVVWVGIIIEKDGSLSGFKIIGKPQPYLDTEAIRIMKASPKWLPGQQEGAFVRVWYTIHIKFDLGDGKLDPPSEKMQDDPPPAGK